MSPFAVARSCHLRRVASHARPPRARAAAVRRLARPSASALLLLAVAGVAVAASPSVACARAARLLARPPSRPTSRLHPATLHPVRRLAPVPPLRLSPSPPPSPSPSRRAIIAAVRPLAASRPLQPRRITPSALPLLSHTYKTQPFSSPPHSLHLLLFTAATVVPPLCPVFARPFRCHRRRSMPPCHHSSAPSSSLLPSSLAAAGEPPSVPCVHRRHARVGRAKRGEEKRRREEKKEEKRKKKEKEKK